MYGVMIDCSRNAVMTVGAVKKFAKILAQMGYDTLMLYTEDTYEVDGEPYFGYLRGRYSKEELKDLDRYCNSIGIELVPCIQMLAHLNCMFKWSAYQDVKDCDDILLIGEEKTYQLLDRMFSTLSQCFSTKKIHIGMDEAYKVGLGTYLERNGYEKRFDIINRHLHKVCEMAKEYDYEPMIWSDMFCKLALQTEDYYAGGLKDLEKIKEQAALPENISLVYWDYYSKDYDRYVNMIKLNQAFGKKVYFAGGAWTWKGFAPDNVFSMEATAPAMKACKDYGVDGWFITMWGDDGHECSNFAILPALMYSIEVAKGNEDMEDIKAKFTSIVGADFDSFLLLDKLDEIGGMYSGNTSKYLFYNDPFMGINDFRVGEKNNDYYAKLADELAQAAGKGEYQVIFDMYEALCRVLSVKAELGIRTRNAYQAGDKEALKVLADDYEKASLLVKAFHKKFRSSWMWEKKPHGFDVQDIRIGGVIQRLDSCKDRLLEYIEGEIDHIPELEEELLSSHSGNVWSRLVTANVISHIL